jgi:diguanylate cyclase (GGDEF)-like protein
MGGDEFVILMPGLSRADTLARKIDLHEVVSRVGREICQEDILWVSVGEAFFPEDGGDAEQLLTEADRRMYQMKHVHHAQRRLGREPLEPQPEWGELAEKGRP